MKLIVMGYARHGKDTFAELLKQHAGLSYTSSSEAVNELFIYEKLREKYKYKDMQSCFEDRVNHREEWYTLIQEFNTPKITRLGEYIFSTWDMYVGLRRAEEFLGLKELYPEAVTVWVDASKRLPPEDITSCSIRADFDFDLIVNNNRPEAKLQKGIPMIYKKIKEIAYEKERRIL